jgi:hypothetical protein
VVPLLSLSLARLRRAQINTTQNSFLLLTNANNGLNGFLGVFAPDVETGHALSLQ